MSSGRSHFANAILKYGKDAFTHSTLAVCDTLEAANLAEQEWIEKLGTRDPEKGFNLARGGSHTPHPFSSPWDRPEYRKIMEERVLPKLIAAGCSPEAQARSKAALNSPEVRKRCSDAQKGKTLSASHLEKMSRNRLSALAGQSDEQKLSISRRMTAGRLEKASRMTVEERESDKLRRSKASIRANTASALRTPDAIAKHRQAAALRRILGPEGESFASYLLSDGYSCGDIAWLLKVKKDTIRGVLRRSHASAYVAFDIL